MRSQKNLAKQRERRAYRVRKRARAANRPRLSVFRSNKHIYVQLIDDVSGRTLCAASTAEKDLGGKIGGDVESAQAVGRAIGQRASEQGVSEVVFDRGPYRYHGRVLALANAAREAGLSF